MVLTYDSGLETLVEVLHTWKHACIMSNDDDDDELESIYHAMPQGGYC